MASEVPAEPGSPPQPGPSSTANDEDVGPILPPSLDKLPTVEEEEEVEVGPTLPQAKKRRTLQYEAQYLASLPLASTYERSYMHRDTVTAVAVARGTDFFLTASADGVLKFWKKLARGVEFAKQYRAHVGPITALAVSADGSLAATASTDASVKVFDIGSFDMIAMLRLPFVPGAIEWAFQRGIPVARLAVSDLATPAIAVFDARSGGDEELGRVTLHSSPVTAMKFSPEQGAVISADAAGMVEYWDPGTLASPATGLRFDFKLDTDLYALARAGTTALSLAVARDGARWAALCADGRVRLFRYATGRLLKVLDESLAAAAELQRSGPEAFRLEPIDFGRRAAAEKELAAALGVVSADAGAGLGTRDAAPPRPATPNVVFDESGNFLLVPSLLGVKVVNLATNACAGVIGGGEGGERFLGLALFQGGGARGRRLLAAGAESAAAVDVAADPTLLACAAGRQRLYLFTRREPAEEASGAGGGRDVYNERPLGGEGEAGEAGGGGGGASGSAAAAPDLPRGAVVHTTRGDIALKLFPDECPRTVENFTTHARNGYYDGVLFHRVIKGFMLQTGDPLGDGTGGESIWGGEFEDEISRNLRHDRPFTLSMANAGPNTNGSQFFITTAATPWLDGKHTVFGRVVKGMDVVVSIEKCKTHPKTDKPFDDIRIINVEPRASVE
uniref:peptidylprolyl isomerase n=2 Tax=Auxenochlorella protothecoides TaxID=3075 RepID=A0A1D1ZNV2_AUXPR